MKKTTTIKRRTFLKKSLLGMCGIVCADFFFFNGKPLLASTTDTIVINNPRPPVAIPAKINNLVYPYDITYDGAGILEATASGYDTQLLEISFDPVEQIDVNRYKLPMRINSLSANGENSVIVNISDHPDALDEDDLARPAGYELFGNYPNPFNGATRINYRVPHRTEAELTVFDVNGRTVRRVTQPAAPGNNSFLWKAKGRFGQPLPSGIYLYRLKADNWIRSAKMNYIK